MEKSETIKELAAAMTKFQAKLPKVSKDAKNPFFKNRYASLSNIIEGTQKLLAEEGLSVIQMPTGEHELTTMLLHESGEYITSTYTMRPTKNDPQGLGSAITYQRRYALGAILNLNIDDDDDGNEASKPKLKPLKEDTEDYTKVFEYLSKGGSINEVKKRFTVSETVHAKLLSELKTQ